MRRILMLVAVAATAMMAVVGGAVVPAGAGGAPTTLVVGKTVQGTATGGFSVVVSCGGSEVATLNFDATGAPTTFIGGDWVPEGGDWKSTGFTPEITECSLNETDADGAATTTWTCDYEFVPVDSPSGLGCDAPSGTDTGPVNLTLGGEGQVESQTATVRFTNTIPDAAAPAAAVPAAPTFTG